MDNAGMLAHLRDHFHVPPENLATEALAYILNSNDRARTAWMGLARRAQGDLPELSRFITQGVSGEDFGIPDLVGLAEGGTQPFLAEVKFNAGLTSHQPVTYLRRLSSSGEPGLLLFIVPNHRIPMIWSEVRRRSTAGDIELGADEFDSLGLVSASHSNIKVSITDWQEVLNVLEESLRGDSDARSLWDLRQLRAMCQREEQEAFVPFTSGDLESRIGRRVVDCIDLFYDVIEDLVADGTADIRGLRPVSTRIWNARYLRIARWECYFGISWTHWASTRPTPIWFLITDGQAQGYAPLKNALMPLLSEDPPRLLQDHGRYLIPIYPQEHVDRDAVRADMTKQVSEIASLLKSVPKPIAGAVEGESNN